MSEVIEMVQVPKETFHRMVSALVRVEKFLVINSRDEWVSEEDACRLLGCERAKLYQLKKKEVKFKRVGKKNQYSRKSIEKYNELMSA